MKIATTTLSSKGQIVIPRSMRAGTEPGTQFIIFKENDSIILKKSTNIQTEEDKEFEARTREAQKRIDNREGIEMEFDDFIKEMEKW